MAVAGASAVDEVCAGKGLHCSRWLQPDSKILPQSSHVSSEDSALVLLGACYYLEHIRSFLLVCVSQV